MLFEKIKHFYELGLYTAQQVRQFYLKDKITREQYKTIIGE